MAPRGGPRNASAPKRSNGAGGKKSTRGGITKRRAGGATRTDRDGDLDMDTPVKANGVAQHDSLPQPTGPRRSARSASAPSRPPRASANSKQLINRVVSGGSGSLASRITAGIDPKVRTNRASRPINTASTMILKVEGLKGSVAASNSDGGLKSLLSFLERKATSVGKLSRTVRIKKSQIQGDSVYITTSQPDGEEILKLSGFDFAGTQVHVSQVSEDGAPVMSTQQLKDTLTSILHRRYNTETKLLDLSNLGQDPMLSQLDSFREATPTKLFNAFMAICDGLFKTPQAKREAIVSISLASNNIDDVSQVMSLADTFPELINLDLRHNQFRDSKSLRKWNQRLRKMEHILLSGNPIEQADLNYPREMMRYFPRLQMINGNQVRTADEVAAAERAKLPISIPSIGPDFRDINNVGESFITDFMPMYDADRFNLAAKYYDDQSKFSLSVSNRGPHPAGTQLPSWTNYIKLSRNFMKITTSHAREQRLFEGLPVIQTAWKNLPPTRHPDIRAETDKYIVDCHPIEGLPDTSGQWPGGVPGMIMTIHGEFDDQDPTTKKETKRAFSRTFLLGPGTPGKNQLGIRVISDMLSLKAYNPLPTTQMPRLQDSTASAPSAEVQKEQMRLELCKQTGLTPEYSTMCLDAANWNFDQALVAFESTRATLPPVAFVQTAI